MTQEEASEGEATKLETTDYQLRLSVWGEVWDDTVEADVYEELKGRESESLKLDEPGMRYGGYGWI